MPGMHDRVDTSKVPPYVPGALWLNFWIRVLLLRGDLSSLCRILKVTPDLFNLSPLGLSNAYNAYSGSISGL